MREESARPRAGCLFYGGLTATVCLVAILLALLLGLHQFRRMLTTYTETQPSELPQVHFSATQLDQLQRRIESFQDAARAGRPTPPLSLSPDEINALIQNEPKLSSVKGNLFVIIEGNQLKGDLSVPLDQLGLRMFKGRYLNGTAEFSLILHDGILNLTAENVRVRGKPLPGVYMDRIRAENLAERLNDNVHASIALNRLRSIQVQDGKLILVPKVEE